jgi:hypothetical protein
LSDPWFHRVEAEHHAGNLTHAAFLVLRKLAGYFGSRAEAWPSHATLAQAAGVSVRSVQRALQAARDLGLLTWAARRIRAGWRSLSSSNIYRKLMPAGRMQTCPRTAGQAGRGTMKKENKGSERSVDALARALRAMQQALMGRRGDCDSVAQQDERARRNAQRQLIELGLSMPRR